MNGHFSLGIKGIGGKLMKNKDWIIDIGTVDFNGKEYTTRIINIKSFGDRRIAGTSLENELMKDGKYVSETARFIDESIFLFVEDKWLSCGDNQLAKMILKNLA